jgi:hypothetical protein
MYAQLSELKMKKKIVYIDYFLINFINNIGYLGYGSICGKSEFLYDCENIPLAVPVSFPAKRYAPEGDAIPGLNMLFADPALPIGNWVQNAISKKIPVNFNRKYDILLKSLNF